MATKIGRDARTGQFITVNEARRRPSTTTVETLPSTSSSNTFQVGRDARTGQFITVSEARRRPSTTVVENIPK